METDIQTPLEAAGVLLQQFIAPDEEVVLAILAAAGLELSEDEDWRQTLTRAFRPRDDDYALVFLGAAAAQARRGYEALWADDGDLVIRPHRGQVQVRVAAALAGALGTDPAAADAFPGGYRGIAGMLVPDRVWVAWEFLEPGETCGLQGNGLVYLGEGRFAWFPKPWRVLE